MNALDLVCTGGNDVKKLYEKNELTFAIVWIIVYCVLRSLADPLNEIIGGGYSVSAAFCVLQAIVLFTFIRRNGLRERYGLRGPKVPARRFLYYVPLVILASGDLWNGAAINYPPAEMACRIVCMLCVGFLEEVIFRVLLFVSIAKDNVRSAVVISSVTFGVGHLINLFNGSGMDLMNDLCQICFAVAVGFLLVTIFYRGGSLFPCIIVYSAINTLSIFANNGDLSMEMQLLHIAVLILLSVIYTLILSRTLPKDRWGGAEAVGGAGRLDRKRGFCYYMAEKWDQSQEQGASARPFDDRKGRGDAAFPRIMS